MRNYLYDKPARDRARSWHSALYLPAVANSIVKQRIDERRITMYELQVEGMSCGHCVKAVTNSVKALDQDAKVDVDLGSKTVRVESGAALHAVKAAIADAGYTVQSGTER
jgi:copper chaperone